ncbi:hypothetical protein BpHYR1_023583 [Brachionus plicatilis]|uniref:Uncharacterized protein n=1 Tax=Brachionus plicatilis TaxID=10195 RepID=A0A3M7TAR2_BRAPC|nr:hypothetical protein BpHYR1_023583 [Brachionus plicatilis]
MTRLVEIKSKNEAELGEFWTLGTDFEFGVVGADWLRTGFTASPVLGIIRLELARLFGLGTFWAGFLLPK